MIRCGNAGNGPNTPGSTEPFRVFLLNVLEFPWKVSRLSQIIPEKLSEYSGDFREFSFESPEKLQLGIQLFLPQFLSYY